MAEERRGAVFLDRDGVINCLLSERGPRETPRTPEEFVLLPGVPEALTALRQTGLSLIVVTNQPNVAKGKTTWENHLAIEQRMQELLGPEAAVDAVYACLHHPDRRQVIVPELCLDCACRKPKPGLINKALADFGARPETCWLIGDSDIDIKAGMAAGLSINHLIAVGSSCSTAFDGICNLDNLWEAAQYITHDER